MSRRRPPILVLFAAIGYLWIPARAANDSLYFLYQRTTYLENLNTPGGWWANPALAGEVTSPTGYTINVTPLSNRYTLASVKYLFPFLGRFGAGIGIMGTGILPPQSTQVNNGGVDYTSHFTFSNPSFQLGIGGNIPKIGSAGILVDLGAEMLPDGFGGSSNFLVARSGLGILSPYFFNCVSASATGMATFHFWDKVYMDGNAKLGLRMKLIDNTITGSAEYTLTLKSGAMQSFYASSSNDYEVFKTMVSIRVFQVAGFLLGYSTDFGYFSDIGNCIHTGLEIRQMNEFPFFGGYDLGISTTWQGLLIHRLWIGYRFGIEGPRS